MPDLFYMALFVVIAVNVITVAVAILGAVNRTDWDD